jgi:error-prone DNA polymerase
MPPSPQPAYVPLRVHGHHSLLTGVDAPAALLARAAGLELPALALTDVDTLAGTVDLLKAAARGGVRPIVGAELSDPSGAPGRVVALVESERGWRNLCKLVSARQIGADPGEAGARTDGGARFDLAASAARYAEGLVLVVDHPRLLIALHGRVARERLFAGISPAALRAARARKSDADAGARGWAELAEGKVPPPERPVAARELCAAARAVGAAILAVPDVWYATPSGAREQRVRVAVKHNALLDDLPEAWLAPPPAHLMAFAELRELYADLPDVPGPFQRHRRRRSGAPECLMRTLAVAERCSYTPPLGGVLFPEIELESGETPWSRLYQLAFEGATRRFRPLRPEVVRRLDYELGTIEKLGFAAYFLLVVKIADFARARGIPSVGRGSAADSLVAYCLGLTDADPLRYRLPFERFLNPARRDRPDIDLDFCWRRRDEVLAHVYEAFGPERTAMIATLATFGLRSAFREAALVHGLPPAEVNRWSRRLPWAESNAAADWPVESGGSVPGSQVSDPPRDSLPAAPFRGSDTCEPGTVPAADSTPTSLTPHPDPRGGTEPGTHPPTSDDATENGTQRAEAGRCEPGTLPPRSRMELARENVVARALVRTPECRAFPFEDERWRAALESARGLLGTPRHFGLHPGGVVVSPGAITDVVSCRRAAKGVVVTEFDKDAVEALGLVKMDLLGNRALTTLADATAELARQGVAIDLERLPEDDPATAALLREGRTLGCFQIESPGMRNLLQQTRAADMDAVIRAVALIRPGPASSGMKDAFVRRARGLEPAHAPHPRLTELLWETHGVMLYQEDVMQTAALLAGLDLPEADLLRRTLQKRHGAGLEPLRARFLEGAAGNGVARADAERVWQLIANFSSFAFCKAHAVTYGRIAYRAAWLKAHHPAVYLTAFLMSETGYYEPRVYVEEARRLGVPILGPDVNRSGATFAVERAAGGVLALRVGLGQVKGLSQAAIERLLEQRAQAGPFLSLPDLLERCALHVDEAAALVSCGALDGFDRTRPELLWRLHLLRAPARRAPPERADDELTADLDRARLDACRATPRTRAADALERARGRTGGWSQRGLGLGAAELERGQSASLFPAPDTPGLVLPGLPDLDPRTRGLTEMELLGFPLARHPVQLLPCPADARLAQRFGSLRAAERPRRGELRPVNPRPCSAVAQLPGGRVTLRGWLAATRRVRTEAGEWMRFLTLEDESGLAEVVLFPDVYRRDGARLVDRGPHCVTGVVEDHFGACTLRTEALW